MARKLRLQYPGAIYHVMNRGDRRDAIFADDADRQRFLETLGHCCQKTGWQVHAYCLMRNHFHSRPTMPLAWIAERLSMGTRGHLAWLLQPRRQSRPAAPAGQSLLGR